MLRDSTLWLLLFAVTCVFASDEKLQPGSVLQVGTPVEVELIENGLVVGSTTLAKGRSVTVVRADPKQIIATSGSMVVRIHAASAGSLEPANGNRSKERSTQTTAKTARSVITRRDLSHLNVAESDLSYLGLRIGMTSVQMRETVAAQEVKARETQVQSGKLLNIDVLRTKAASDVFSRGIRGKFVADSMKTYSVVYSSAAYSGASVEERAKLYLQILKELEIAASPELHDVGGRAWTLFFGRRQDNVMLITMAPRDVVVMCFDTDALIAEMNSTSLAGACEKISLMPSIAERRENVDDKDMVRLTDGRTVFAVDRRLHGTADALFSIRGHPDETLTGEECYTIAFEILFGRAASIYRPTRHDKTVEFAERWHLNAAPFSRRWEVEPGLWVKLDGNFEFEFGIVGQTRL